MSRVKIRVQDQLQRINQLHHEMDKLRSLDLEILTKRPDKKTWSTIEVIEHMILAHKPYEIKLDETISKLSDTSQPVDEMKSTAIPSFLIKRFPPKRGKIKFKMKTMKQFKPLLDLQKVDRAKVDVILKNFDYSLDHLTSTIKAYRKKDTKKIRFNSAIGSSVKFNVAEACEFVICHNERHMQQIQNILNLVKE